MRNWAKLLILLSFIGFEILDVYSKHFFARFVVRRGV